MLIKLNLQRFAPPIEVLLNITLDSGIESIHMTTSEDIDRTITENGIYRSLNNTITTFVVTLKNGYIMDKMLVGTSEVTATSENTYEYTFNTAEIAVSFTSKKATSQVSIDLTSLSGWGNVANGQHVIQVVAKADNYKDSEKSTAVSFTKAPQVYTDCLTFTGETSEFTLKATNKDWDGTLEWSTDHTTWTTLAGTEAMQSVDKKLYLRGKGNTSFGKAYGVAWQLSAKAGCSGNIQTLLDWENPPTSISSNHCYISMFFECANLTTAPELPATELTNSCYNSLFYGCTNLTTAPELPAETLAERCYYRMFYKCTKLKVNTSAGNKIFICPTSIPYRAVEDMFINTGGTFTGTPTAGNTYYWTA